MQQGMETGTKESSELEDVKRNVAEHHDRLTRIELKLDQFATKEDLATAQKEYSDKQTEMIRWVIGTIVIGVLGILTTAITSGSSPSSPPIVIQSSAPPHPPCY